MSTSSDLRDVGVGDEVISADGHKLGSVAEVHPDAIVVEKGLFFATNHVIPRSAIASAGNGEIVLTVARDASSGIGQAAGVADRTTERSAAAQQAEDDIRRDVTAATSGICVEEMAVGEEIHIPVYEEELAATVRPVEGGPIRVAKRIVSEGTVSDDEIRVERRIINRPGDGADSQAFEQIIIEVPLQQDLAGDETAARLADEIVVTKEVIQRTERVTDTVRREEVRVDEGNGVIGL